MSAPLSSPVRVLGVIALSCLFAYGGLAHDPEDFYEPDDTPAQARWIDTDGSAQSHTFHTHGDTDYSQFYAQAGATATIETSYLTDGCDTVLRLYDPQGRQIAQDDDGGYGRASRIVKVLPYTGLYRIEVSLWSSYNEEGESCRYDLSVSLSPPPPPDGYEVDDAPEYAVPLATDGQPQAHTLHTPLDRDWVTFQVPQGHLLTIETYRLRTGCDTVLNLYDADLTRIAESDDYAGTDRSFIRAAVGRGGTYYARVHHSGNNGGRGKGYYLKATVMEPQIRGQFKAPVRVAFPIVRVSASAAKQVTISNTSSTEVLQVTLTGKEGPYEPELPVEPIVLLPRRTYRFQVRFRPQVRGVQAGKLTFSTTDPARPTATIQLTGRGR